MRCRKESNNRGSVDDHRVLLIHEQWCEQVTQMHEAQQVNIKVLNHTGIVEQHIHLRILGLNAFKQSSSTLIGADITLNSWMLKLHPVCPCFLQQSSPASCPMAINFLAIERPMRLLPPVISMHALCSETFTKDIWTLEIAT